jgi:hypothetical protein
MQPCGKQRQDGEAVPTFCTVCDAVEKVFNALIVWLCF